MKKLTLIIPTIAAALVLAACGGDDDSGDAGAAPAAGATGTTTTRTASLADRLPEAYRGKPLKISFGVGYPPMGFTDDKGDLTGVNIDLARAVGEVLGVEVRPSTVAFETVIPGIQSGKFDASFFGAVVNPERLEILDMATYVLDGNTFVTTKEHADVGSSTSDLCGLGLGVVAGNAALPELEKLSSACTSDGKEKIAIKTFPNNAEANLAVQGGKADLALSPISTAGYLAKTNPEFKVTGPKLGALKIAAVADKGNGLGKALVAAINEVIASGKYQEILDTYGASDNAVTESQLNPDPS